MTTYRMFSKSKVSIDILKVALGVGSKKDYNMFICCRYDHKSGEESYYGTRLCYVILLEIKISINKLRAILYRHDDPESVRLADSIEIIKPKDLFYDEVWEI